VFYDGGDEKMKPVDALALVGGYVDEELLARNEYLEHFTLIRLRRILPIMRPTSIDIRMRIVAARTEDGQSMGEIAQRFKIPKGTVQNILERWRDDGTTQPRPRLAGRKPAFSPEERRRLVREVEAHPDATLAELRDRSGKQVSLVCLYRTLRQLGFTRKKNLYVRANSSTPM
jgi:transposase